MTYSLNYSWKVLEQGLNAPFGARCFMMDRDPFIRQIEALAS